MNFRLIIENFMKVRRLARTTIWYKIVLIIASSMVYSFASNVMTTGNRMLSLVLSFLPSFPVTCSLRM